MPRMFILEFENSAFVLLYLGNGAPRCFCVEYTVAASSFSSLTPSSKLHH